MDYLDYFKRILTHYLTMALERAGVRIDSDTHAEIAGMCEALESGIRSIVQDAIEQHKAVSRHNMFFGGPEK